MPLYALGCMHPPPWHITHSACERYAHMLRWRPTSIDARIADATNQLEDKMAAATFKERDRYGRELWRSPKRHGGMRWVIDPRRDHTAPVDQLPKVIWVGNGAPPFQVWAG